MSKRGVSFRDQWGPKQASFGHTQMPRSVFHFQRELGLTSVDFNVLAQITSFKFDQRNPHPSEIRIARRIGKHEKTVSRSINRLRKLGLIEVISHPGARNEYDLSPLNRRLDALVHIVRGVSTAPDAIVEGSPDINDHTPQTPVSYEEDETRRRRKEDLPIGRARIYGNEMTPLSVLLPSYSRIIRRNGKL